MKIELFSYKIPFVEPFQTAAGTFEKREGILIRLKKDGIISLGEVSPLPSFSNEPLNEVFKEFRHSENQIKNHFASSFTLESTLQFLQFYRHLPSLQFGLMTLAATFLAQQKKIPLQQLFSTESKKTIAINAVVGMGPIGNWKKLTIL